MYVVRKGLALINPRRAVPENLQERTSWRIYAESPTREQTLSFDFHTLKISCDKTVTVASLCGYETADDTTKIFIILSEFCFLNKEFVILRHRARRSIHK